uniref:Retrotransposon Orf1 n=1 Tax=Tanacetum cinerariifolium TaxID=118510 RepID=A0A699IKJ7_TANCI|nr:retrotransposon Orf1 [Tanacetum cinerariifolium]
MCLKQTNKFQKDQPQVKTLTVNKNGTPPSKGIKSPSKLLSIKYQSHSSLGEQNRNLSSPKRIYFINTTTILSREDEPRKPGSVKPDTKENDHDTIVKVEEEGEENPSIVGGCLLNLKIPFNIGHVHVEKAYIDLNSPINVMTCMQYNWIMRKQLKPREDPEGIKGISYFIGRVEGMHIFVRNFTYILDFMIVEDITSIIDPRLPQVVLGKSFVKISNMAHDLSLGIVKFSNETNEIAYKMPHKIELFNSLTDLEKKHTKSVYFRNEEDKRKE